MMNPINGSVSGRRSGEVVADQFPAGLRVLVVDDDPTCLAILEKMLRACLYEVTKCNRAEVALSLLRKNKNGYDIVISDVHMPDIDGFKLLECVGLEMDLPVIMMSADESKSVVMKGITHGACDYLIKPVRIEALKNIWQHVVRRKKNELKDLDHSGSIEEGERNQKQNEEVEQSSSVVEGNNWRNSKKRREEDEEQEDKEDTSTLKKPRVVWSVELHQQFVAAVNQLGVDKAVPKKILELMNVPGLTRENVASHLQKYRIYLRRLGGVSQHQGNLNNAFISQQDPGFGTLSSLNGLDLQALAIAGQIPAQSLAALQAAGLGRQSPKPGISLPIVDQRNVFSFENPKVRFGESKQTNLLHGVPMGMETKQLTGLQRPTPPHVSTQLIGASLGGQGGRNNNLMMQMGQLQPRGPMVNENTGPRISCLTSSSMGQPIVSSGISGMTFGRNGLPDSRYSSVSQQTSQMLNLPVNQAPDLPGNNCPIGSAPGIPASGSKRHQEEVNSSDVKGSGSFIPSYDIFNDLQQHKLPDWDLQSVGLAFDGSQNPSAIQDNLSVSSSVSVSQRFSTASGSGQNITVSGLVNMPNLDQHNLLYAENSIRVKSERIPDTSCPPTLFPEQYNQDDVMNTLLKQQEGIVPPENEFDFDGYSFDNIPV